MPSRRDLVGQGLDPVELGLHAGRHVQPAQPVGDGCGGLAGGIRGPDGDVPPPDASYNVLSQQRLGGAVGRFVGHGSVYN